MILNKAFERAHKIASAHGHWWTKFIEPRPQGWTLDQIAEAQASAINNAEEWAMIGLSFSLSHSTATGRLEWHVAPDGAVTLLGCRAGRALGLPALSVPVATATVDLGGNARVVYPRGHAALSAGVVGALKGALSALGLDDQAVLLALGPEAVALWAAEQMAWAIAQVEAERPYGGGHGLRRSGGGGGGGPADCPLGGDAEGAAPASGRQATRAQRLKVPVLGHHPAPSWGVQRGGFLWLENYR